MESPPLLSPFQAQNPQPKNKQQQQPNPATSVEPDSGTQLTYSTSNEDQSFPSSVSVSGSENGTIQLSDQSQEKTLQEAVLEQLDLKSVQKSTIKEPDLDRQITNMTKNIQTLQLGKADFNKAVHGIQLTDVQTFHKKLRSKKTTKNRVDVTRQYPTLFGLNPMRVVADSSSEADSEAEGETGVGRRKLKLQLQAKASSRRLPRQAISDLTPTPTEKNFLSKLQHREAQLHKDILDIQSHLSSITFEKPHAIPSSSTLAKGTLYKVPKQKSNNSAPVPGPGGDSKEPSRQLMDFLQATGGHTGGWPVQRHQTFLRVREKNESRPLSAKLRVFSRALPDKSPEEIVEHLQWIEKYEELMEANKKHIREWNLQKQQEREMAFHKMTDLQKAKAQQERDRQEQLSQKRSEERSRNLEKLAVWKMNNAKRKLQLQKESNNINTSERIKQIDQDITDVKRQVLQISSLNKEMSKSLNALRPLERSGTTLMGNKDLMIRRQRARTGSSDGGSSGFGDMSMDEIEKFERMSNGNGSKSRKLAKSLKSVPNKNRFESAVSKKLLEDFRRRDLDIVKAKRDSMEQREKQLQNPAFLTDEQVREKMKSISTASRLMEPTKGWRIRQELVAEEKLSRTPTPNNQEDDDHVHEIPKVRLERILQPKPTVAQIPKLGMPNWRKT